MEPEFGSEVAALRAENAALKSRLAEVTADRDRLLAGSTRGQAVATGNVFATAPGPGPAAKPQRLARRGSSTATAPVDQRDEQRADTEAILACQSKIKAATYSFGSTECRRKAGLTKLFAKYDQDSSGSLSVGEFKAALRKVAVLSPHQVSLLISAVDRDGNRVIEIEEFVSFMFATTPSVPKRKGMAWTAPERASLRRASLESITAQRSVQAQASQMEAEDRSPARPLLVVASHSPPN